jgi:hypothetical protein
MAPPYYNGNPAYLLHIKATDFRMVGGSTSTDRPILERCDCNAGKGEMFWCVTNEPGTLIIRRNGKVAIVGNCIGRGTRKAPAKADCLILDVCDISSRHQLSVQHLPEATGIAYSRISEEALEPRAPRQPARPLLANETAYRPAPVQTRAVDLVLKWEQVAEGRYTLALSEGTLWVAPREGGYIVGIVFKDGRKQQLTPRPVSLDWAQAFADDKTRLISSKSARLVDRGAAWRSRPASQKQLKKLDRWCIRYPAGCTAGAASDLIDQAFRPLRMRQGVRSGPAGRFV